jgi:bifunctional DNA-binding transcriptional regulator/antitoxin component of YhaV-PrlF toxin-antitoxin module
MALIGDSHDRSFRLSCATFFFDPVPLQIDADGRLLMPIELRRQMKIDADGRLTARIVEGELRLVTPTVALEHLQRLFRQPPGSPSMVDELIAERRAEAERE